MSATNRIPRLRPLAAALASLFATGMRFAPPAARAVALSRDDPPAGGRAWLSIGATLTAMTLAPSPALSQQAGGSAEATLPAVTVEGARDREAKGYQGGTTGVGKIQQLPRDIPQSVTVVPEQLLYDRNVDSLKDALRNVPGITFAAAEGGRIGDNFTIRGFTAVGDVYLDGIRDIAQYQREVFNLEQVDVMRGSSSMFFGRGSTGGVINQASKQPSLWDRYSTAATVGSYDYKRVTADLNKRLGENAAVRLNLMKHGAGSFRDEVESNRWGIAPSVRFGIGTAHEFSLSFYRLQDDNIPDYGIPYFRGRPMGVPVNTFYGIANADFQRDDTRFFTGAYTWRISSDTTLKTVLRKAAYNRDLWVGAPSIGAAATITPATVVTRGRQSRGSDENTLTSQTDLTTRFSALGFKHQFLVGTELAKESAERWSYLNTTASPATTVGNPNSYPVLSAAYRNQYATRIGDVSYNAYTFGVYAQDIVELTPGWKLVLGTRYDRFQGTYDRGNAVERLARIDRVWSYRSGVIYQPSDFASYYAVYGTSFNPSGELYSLDVPGANTPPEKSRNMEVGAKWELFEGDLSLRTALFRAEKTNERNTDLLTPNVFLLSGKRHTDGVEIEAAGRVTRNWEVFAGIGRYKAIIDQTRVAAELGRVPLLAPPYTANLWSTYKVGNGWKAGGGFQSVGMRYGQNANTTAVPSFISWDAMLAYEQKRYTVRMNVLNLFDKKFYDQVYQGFSVPGTSRAVQLTLELKYD